MRRIVLCHKCSRRYDASKKEPGWRFHCRCGETLTVQASESHTAEEVCCSSCGGPREKGVNRCGFCGADFTIHERDLNTVCPECFARVSDRAKHCCQCGTMLAAEEYAGQETDFACPVCGDEVHLASRPLGQEKVNMLECPLCAGLWLGHEAFDQLRDRVKRQGAQSGEATVPQSRPKTASQQKGPRYRACISEMRGLRERRSFAYARECAAGDEFALASVTAHADEQEPGEPTEALIPAFAFERLIRSTMGTYHNRRSLRRRVTASR